MKIHLEKVRIKDLISGFDINEDTGQVSGYDGKLNIRPSYQREFIYKSDQQVEVVKTILKEFPLNIIYWAKNDNGNYELIDGQQRIVSIAKFFNMEFSVNNHFYHSISDEERFIFDNYELSVYVCEGTEIEKIKWFETINIAGEKLTNQELRNAIYSGPFVNELKKYFSKRNCPATKYKDNMGGKSIRQEWLESILNWASLKENLNIDTYMAKYKNNDKEAAKVWKLFLDIMNWVEKIFPYDRNYQKFMSGVNWGKLYLEHGDTQRKSFQNEVNALIMDDDVERKRGIFYFVLTKEERYLNLRQFSESMKLKSLISQNYICNNRNCNKKVSLNNSHADHIIPWNKNGKTSYENLQILCDKCNRIKSSR